VTQDHAEGSGAEAEGGHRILLRALGDHRAPDDAAEQRCVDDRDGQRGIVEAGAEHRRDPDGQDQRREAEEHVHRPADDEIGGAADVAAGQSQDRARYQRDADARDGHAERDTTAVDRPAQHVTSEAIRAERMRKRRRLERVGDLHLRGIVGRDDAGEDRQQDHDHDDRGAEEDERVPPDRSARDLDQRPGQWRGHGLSHSGSGGPRRRRRDRRAGSTP
jgi:hypothetical protein